MLIAPASKASAPAVVMRTRSNVPVSDFDPAHKLTAAPLLYPIVPLAVNVFVEAFCKLIINTPFVSVAAAGPMVRMNDDVEFVATMAMPFPKNAALLKYPLVSIPPESPI